MRREQLTHRENRELGNAQATLELKPKGINRHLRLRKGRLRGKARAKVSKRMRHLVTKGG